MGPVISGLIPIFHGSNATLYLQELSINIELTRNALIYWTFNLYLKAIIENHHVINRGIIHRVI